MVRERRSSFPLLVGFRSHDRCHVSFQFVKDFVMASFIFNTASRTSSRIAAIGFRMYRARLQVRHSSGRCRFAHQQRHLCGVFGSSVHRCVPSQVASVSTPQVALHFRFPPSVFGCTGHVCKLAVRPDVAASISSNITFPACFGHLCIRAPQVKPFRFHTASQSSFRIAAIGVRMHMARLEARHSSGRCRFDQQQYHFCGVFLIIGASVRPKSSRSRFNTASHSSFRIAAIGFWMHAAGLQSRHSSRRCRFDQQQHHFCGVFRSSVPSQVAPVSTPPFALHSGLLQSVFGCTGV